jgi:hypothetical protein
MRTRIGNLTSFPSQLSWAAQLLLYFRFNVPNPVDFAANPWRGVGHTSDVYYMFNGAT